MAPMRSKYEASFYRRSRFPLSFDGDVYLSLSKSGIPFAPVKHLSFDVVFLFSESNLRCVNCLISYGPCGKWNKYANWK